MMRYNEEEIDQLIEAINCDTDWIELQYALLKFPEFFTAKDRVYVQSWLSTTENLFLNF